MSYGAVIIKKDKLLFGVLCQLRIRQIQLSFLKKSLPVYARIFYIEFSQYVSFRRDKNSLRKSNHQLKSYQKLVQ